MRNLTMAAVAALFPLTAGSAPVCDSAGDATVFFCQIGGSDREVAVCDLQDGTYRYVYGRPDRPELDLVRTRDQLIYRDWNGMGFRFWANLAFENDGHHYRVWFDADKDMVARDGLPAIAGAVDIFAPGVSPVDGEPTARKECRADTIDAGLMGLDIPQRTD